MKARELLAELIAFPTVSSRPLDDLASQVAQRWADLGLEVERYETGRPGKLNLVARAGPRGDAGRTAGGLLLSGHMDVVPVEGQPWTSDPFTLVERGGLLYGRGTADMKGFLAATTAALSRVDLSRLERELVLVWTCDEEVGCLGSAVLAEQLAAEGRPLPRACVIGEPTSFRMLRMHPGHVATELVLGGAAAHSSRPDLGVNAIEAAADAIAAVRRLADELTRERRFEELLERPWVAVNVATIEGGSAINIVPDRCVVRLGYRPLPGADPLEVHERIVARIRALAPRGGFEARVLRVTPAMLTEARSGTWDLLREHAAHEHEGAATFATDGGNLARLGVEPIVFGPGAIEVAHQADEHLAIAELDRAVDVVEALVRARCGPT